MRIAIFTDSFYPELGGIQDSIADLGKALGRRGHHLLIVAPRAAPQDYRTAGVDPREPDLGERVTVHRCRSWPIPGSTGQSRLMLPWPQLRPLRQALDVFAPDVLHLHTFLTAGALAVREARRLARPLVGTNHWAIDGFDRLGPWPVASPLARGAARWVSRFYRRCALVTTPSADLQAAMQARGFGRIPVVVSNPIDTERFRPAEPLERIRLRARFDLTGPTLVYAGRLAREKRIDVLIEALAQLKRHPTPPRLLLAGHGTDHDRLRSIAHARHVEDRVRFLGPLSGPELADVLRAADCFVTASTTETQCMALLQAMATGLPAVVANCRALPEVLGADAGRLARPGDPASFAACITALLDRPVRMLAAGRAARQRASLHTIDSVTDQWESLYAGLIA